MAANWKSQYTGNVCNRQKCLASKSFTYKFVFCFIHIDNFYTLCDGLAYPLMSRPYVREREWFLFAQKVR